jgi:hypothetical protein
MIYENPVAIKSELNIAPNIVTKDMSIPQPLFIEGVDESVIQAAQLSAYQSYLLEQKQKKMLNGSVASEPMKPKVYWRVLLASLQKESALKLQANAKKHGYVLELKNYKTSPNVYSVRTQLFTDLSQAKKVKRKLDRLFGLHDSQIDQFTPPN